MPKGTDPREKSKISMTAASGAEPPKPQPPKRTKEIGDASLMFNGIIAGEEYNPKLKGTRRIQQYDEMRLGDAHVAASLKVIKLPLLSANWSIQPASEKREDRQIAEWVEDNLFNRMTRTWQETLTNVLLHLDYGVMPMEKVYQFDEDGRISLRKLAVRHPRTISRWEMKNGENGIEQTTTNGVFQIPIEKLAIFVNEKEGDNWEGRSVLRSAWKHWLFKDKAELIEIMAMERHGLGVPYGKTGTGATPEEEQKLDEILAAFRANEKGFVRFPQDFEVGLLDMKSGTIKNPNDFIKRCEWAIMLNVLATFMQMGSGAVGSFALFKGSNTFFLMALEYVAKHISEVFNHYVIKDLVNMNFLTDRYPKLTYDKIGTVDINQLTTALQRAVQTGVLTVDSNLEEYLRDAMDLPEFTGETLVDPSLADGVLAELDASVAGLESSFNVDPQEEDGDEDPGETEGEEPTDEEVAEAEASYNKDSKKKFIATYGAEFYEEMKTITAGAKGVPLSEETKRKISEALKKLKAKGGKKLNKAKKKSGGKKTDPRIAQKRQEMKAVREEARAFNAQVRRELLEAKAKGIKLSPEDQAKKELDIFNRKEEIAGKIRKLQDEIDEIKEASKPAAPDKKEASHRGKDLEATPDSLLDMFEAVTKEIDTVRNS